jgi:endoglucanase
LKKLRFPETRPFLGYSLIASFLACLALAPFLLLGGAGCADGTSIVPTIHYDLAVPISDGSNPSADGNVRDSVSQGDLALSDVALADATQLLDSSDGGGAGIAFSLSPPYLVTLKVIEMVWDGELDVALATAPQSWKLTSSTDTNYSQGVAPVAVHRSAAVLDAEDRDKNGQNEDDRVLRHSIYLVFDKALLNDNDYSLSFAGSLGKPYVYDGTDGAWKTPSTLDGPWPIQCGVGAGTARAIKVNQHGYNLSAQERYAYLGYFLGDGGPLTLPSSITYTVHRASDKGQVLSGKATSRGFDEQSGEWVEELDLSALAEGSYFVEVPEMGRSLTFRVGQGAAYEVFYTAARGLFHQRAGIPLLPNHTHWSRGACHGDVFQVDELENWGEDFSSATSKQNPITLVGGWHDAGDFDRRPTHLAVVAHLLIAAEMFPSRLGDKTLNLPESGNGLPDVLDEALFGLGLWQGLQGNDGGVGAGTQSHGHPGGVHCEKDKMPYWTYSANRWTSYGFAATASHAARLLKGFTGFAPQAATLQSQAVAAWNWAEKQTEVGTTSPVPRTAEHALAELKRQRLSAAGQLFALTDEVSYQTIYQELWAELRGPTHNTTAFTLWGMATATGPNTDSTLRSDVRKRYAELAQQFISYLDDSPYRASRKASYPLAWGSATNTVSYAAPLIMAYHFSAQQSYIDAISLNADYQLGAHPLAQSWITGLGYFTPEFPLHLNSMYDSVKEVVPGLPINGPNGNTRGHPCQPLDYWQCLVYNGFYPAATKDFATSPLPPMRHYAPWARMAPMNEFTVWTDMAYTAFAYSFLYAVGKKPTVNLHKLLPSAYPLNALTVK